MKIKTTLSGIVRKAVCEAGLDAAADEVAAAVVAAWPELQGWVKTRPFVVTLSLERGAVRRTPLSDDEVAEVRRITAAANGPAAASDVIRAAKRYGRDRLLEFLEGDSG